MKIALFRLLDDRLIDNSTVFGGRIYSYAHNQPNGLHKNEMVPFYCRGSIIDMNGTALTMACQNKKAPLDL